MEAGLRGSGTHVFACWLAWLVLAGKRGGTGLRQWQGAECVMPRGKVIMQATFCMRTCHFLSHITLLAGTSAYLGQISRDSEDLGPQVPFSE